MKPSIFLLSRWLCLSLVLGCACANAQPSPRPTMDWTWIKAPWKDDDKPFVLTRQGIDRLAQQGRLNDKVVAQYKRSIDVEFKWTDPLAQFRWAYASYRLQIMLHTPGQKRLEGIIEALERARDADDTRHLSYNFCRLSYLCYMMQGFAVSPLKKAGERLLQHTPNDYEVKFFQIQLLDVRDASESAKRVRYFADLKKQNPNDVGLQSYVAQHEYINWLGSGRKTDALRTIEEYKRLLQMGLSRQARKDTLERIDKIKNRMDRYEQVRLNRLKQKK